MARRVDLLKGSVVQFAVDQEHKHVPNRGHNLDVLRSVDENQMEKELQGATCLTNNLFLKVESGTDNRDGIGFEIVPALSRGGLSQ